MDNQPTLKWKRYKVQAQKRKERNESFKNFLKAAGFSLLLMNDWSYTVDKLFK